MGLMDFLEYFAFWRKFCIFKGILVELSCENIHPWQSRAERSCSDVEKCLLQPCCLHFVTEQLAVAAGAVCLISEESEKFYGMFRGCSVVEGGLPGLTTTHGRRGESNTVSQPASQLAA